MSLNFKKISPVLLGSVLGLAAFLGFQMADRGQGRDARAGLSVDQVELFAEVVERIREEYVEPVDEATLVENAIRSVVADLDAHSRFLNEDDYADILISASSHYSGVGLDVSVDDGRVTVVKPLEGAPAERAGILPNDVVVSVDDVPIDPDNTQEAISRMRGEAGTTVTLDVMRDGEDDSLRFALTRAEVRLTTVHTDYLGDGFAYIRLSSFTDGTGEELREATDELLSEHDLQAVVLDMRDNPGGTLGAAVEVADAFMEEGLIVRGEGPDRRGEIRGERDSGRCHRRPQAGCACRSPLGIGVGNRLPRRCRKISARGWWANAPSARAPCRRSFPWRTAGR